jgi:hypothetical protein
MKANPRNTSRMYVRRGYVVEDLALADCAFSCTKCGRTVDRNYNASLNSLRACGQEILLCFPFSEEVVYSKFPEEARNHLSETSRLHRRGSSLITKALSQELRKHS